MIANVYIYIEVLYARDFVAHGGSLNSDARAPQGTRCWRLHWGTGLLLLIGASLGISRLPLDTRTGLFCSLLGSSVNSLHSETEGSHAWIKL